MDTFVANLPVNWDMPESHSMSNSAKRVWIGVLLAMALCGLLGYFCPTSVWKTIAAIQPEWAVAALCCFVLNLFFRGARLAVLAGGENQAAMFSWVHCAARHQLVFSILPSASGDIGFPFVANKLCGLNYGSGTRVIALYRFQDMVALAALLAFGTALISEYTALIVVACIAIPIALYWSDRLVGRVFRLLFSAACHVPRIRNCRLFLKIENLISLQAQTTTTSNSTRVQLVIWTVMSWSMSTAAFWCLFTMVGENLSVGTTLIVVSGLNLFGTINALTIGGLGIGESALATILIYLGSSYDAAIATALVVRPSALIVTLSGCLLIELVALTARIGVASIFASARPTRERAEPQA